ncbi:hypothetical protein FRC08_015581 [Ceratobasidium sp. 394]|nr:hypothetical protein FRC08_015581 [Ceratobasidium sp. 394]KAG9076261.1 hypothetical protein FS749_011984 [Ceratobasidium sp. UAMH 11750]
MKYMHVRRFTTPRTKPYISALQRLSARTGTPFPSLLVSFAILHELTAVVPLVGVFFGARAVGAGESVVRAVDGWGVQMVRGWMDEGEAWAGRVGRRYGVFGFEKGGSDQGERGVAGDVANAVLAYGVVKALLPVRIGLSLWLSPAFSRGVVEPVRAGIVRLYRKV